MVEDLCSHLRTLEECGEGRDGTVYSLSRCILRTWYLVAGDRGESAHFVLSLLQDVSRRLAALEENSGTFFWDSPMPGPSMGQPKVVLHLHLPQLWTQPCRLRLQPIWHRQWVHWGACRPQFPPAGVCLAAVWSQGLGGVCLAPLHAVGQHC